jgi:hypothetical protein
MSAVEEVPPDHLENDDGDNEVTLYLRETSYKIGR